MSDNCPVETPKSRAFYCGAKCRYWPLASFRGSAAIGRFRGHSDRRCTQPWRKCLAPFIEGFGSDQIDFVTTGGAETTHNPEANLFLGNIEILVRNRPVGADDMRHEVGRVHRSRGRKLHDFWWRRSLGALKPTRMKSFHFT
jgi:hypothetical protein